MNPLVSDVNFVPSSTACVSKLSTIDGVALAAHKLEVAAGARAGAGAGTGAGAVVVKDEVASATSALPATSFTPAEPLLTTIV